MKLPFFVLIIAAASAAAASASASASFISASVFEPHGSATGRNLLQQLKSCSMNFEFLNYTIITSKCKGPDYPARACCTSFVEFACPYADYINDGTTDCASTMFSYINLYGSYPPGLFASECSDGKYGLTCPANSPQASDKPSDDSAAARNTQRPFSLVTVTLVLGSVLGFLFSLT